MSDSVPPDQEPINSIPPQGEAGKESSETPINLLLHSDVQPPPRYKKPAKDCRPDQTPIGKYILEIVAAGILAAYTVAAFQQLGAMRGQLGEIIRQYPELQESANAAKNAAAAAEEANRQNAKLFITGNRPWLFMNPTIEKSVARQGQKLSIYVRIENFGKSPAINVSRAEWRITIIPIAHVKRFMAELKIPVPPQTGDIGMTVAPNDPYTGRGTTVEGPVLDEPLDWTPGLRQSVKRHFTVRCRSIVGRD